MEREFKTISEAINVVYAMGYKDIQELSFGVNCIKTVRCSHQMVCIERLHQDCEITFNGETFEDWKAQT